MDHNTQAQSPAAEAFALLLSYQTSAGRSIPDGSPGMGVIRQLLNVLVFQQQQIDALTRLAEAQYGPDCLGGLSPLALDNPFLNGLFTRPQPDLFKEEVDEPDDSSPKKEAPDLSVEIGTGLSWMPGGDRTPNGG